MAQAMPQEIEVWYVIPALRREIAKIFVSEYKLSQKESAKLLGITESAVSQYLKSKRGGELKFSKEDLAKIKITAKKIVKDKDIMKHMYDLCIELRGSKTICALHKKDDPNLPKVCRICSK